MLLKNVRLAFGDDLFTAVSVMDGGPAYSCQFLVDPKSDEYKAAEAAILEVAKAKWPKEYQKVLASVAGVPNKMCWLDGNKRTYDGYENMWALSARRPEKKGMPLYLDRKRNPLSDNGTLYSGCYVNASVQFWAQDNKHGKAIRCELLGVQFVKDGDSFSSGSKASVEDFDDLGDGADTEDMC